MIAIKSSRKSVRLVPDEEDNLLAGVDFQIYYLGRKEIQIDNNGLDAVVEGIYSQYMCNGDLKNPTQLTITVDTNQIIFRDVMTHHIEFIIALTNVKSVYCANKKTKFPNAVIIVCCLPSQTTATLHVLHCLNQSQAREFYNAVNRAFDYHGDALNRDFSSQSTENKAIPLKKANMELEANAVSRYEVNTRVKSTKYQHLNSVGEKRMETSLNESSGLLGAEAMPEKHENVTTPIKETAQSKDERSRSRAKSAPQTKGAEGAGLLDNIDPDDAFDDEFANLARNRSLSNNIKARFGR